MHFSPLNLFCLFVLEGLLASSPVPATGSDDSTRTRQLSLMWGPAAVARQDKVFSPFVHSDWTSSNFGLAYTAGRRNQHHIRVLFISHQASLVPSYTFFEEGKETYSQNHSFNFLDLEYGFRKRIGEKGKTTTSVGVEFTTQVQVLNYGYGRSSSFGYFFGSGVGFSFAQRKQLKVGTQLGYCLRLPLLHWMARSPYLVNDDEFIENISSHSTPAIFGAFIADGNLVSLNRLQAFDAELFFQQTLSRRLSLGLNYQLSVLHASRPRPLLQFRNRCFLTLSIQL